MRRLTPSFQSGLARAFDPFLSVETFWSIDWCSSITGRSLRSTQASGSATADVRVEDRYQGE
jgi:hypothetical protein